MPSYDLDFHHLARRVEEGAFELRVDSPPGLEAQLQEHEEALLAEASTLRQELDLAVQRWIVHGAFPTLLPRPRRFLYFRFLAAFRFLDLLSLPEGGASVFRVAGMKETQFLHWLLCEWGHHHGTVEGLSDYEYSWLLKKDTRK
jgi:hypothetical protein